MAKKQQVLMVYLFLTVATLVAFWQVTHGDFITYDDLDYVKQNPSIQNGLTPEGITWAFTTGYASNWHPLTWISHMVDIDLFGLQPRGHHLTNLLFHIANTLLLFFLLHRMTKALWQSAFVAALFALHPVHVESVAWVAERKDVLSTFFWMLTIGAYLSYVARPRILRYLLVLFFFALGLLAKPMVVTLPFVLLLLDYWPLERLIPKTIPAKGKKQAVPAVSPNQWALIRPLIREKIPFFALTVLSSIITYLVQQKGGAMLFAEHFSFGARCANAVVSYVLYMVKMLWPTNLAVVYPLPESWPFWEVLGSALLLIVITVMAVWRAKRFPYLAVGWLWYVGTLVPVIGIVQVGAQAMANRYTYIPLIGLFIMVAWGVPELIKNWRYRKEALIGASALALSCLFVVTWIQVGYWQNSITLLDYTLRVTKDNFLAYTSRGEAYGMSGNYTRAIADYGKAIEINPKYAEAYSDRGTAYYMLGKYTQAIADFGKAVDIHPKYSAVYSNRGVAYGVIGNYTQAIRDYNRAIEIGPGYATVYNNRGVAYDKLGNYTQAIADYDKAIEINPRYTEAYKNRDAALQRGTGHP